MRAYWHIFCTAGENPSFAKAESAMSTNESNNRRQEFDSGVPERKLWLAVIVQAMEEWRSGNLRRQREAEEFLFNCRKDFATVCSSAGIDDTCLLSKLTRVKPLLHPAGITADSAGVIVRNPVSASA